MQTPHVGQEAARAGARSNNECGLSRRGNRQPPPNQPSIRRPLPGGAIRKAADTFRPVKMSGAAWKDTPDGSPFSWLAKMTLRLGGTLKMAAADVTPPKWLPRLGGTLKMAALDKSALKMAAATWREQLRPPEPPRYFS